MEGVIGGGVYLVLALAVAVGIYAVFETSGRKHKLNTASSHPHSPLFALALVAEETQRQSSKAAEQPNSLPWVIPTAMPPTTGAFTESKNAAPTIEELVARLNLIEARLDRITEPALK